ncbi:MAG: helix-turn-helix domain-containing protein, partial [Planctomycetaceae bacterium]|nr:helix-turn-helix domain-containing protein [Planctomycetaceae bacterium]
MAAQDRRLGQTLVTDDPAPANGGDLDKDESLRARLNHIANDMSVRELAKRLDIPNQTLSRHLRKGSIPASLCRKLVEQLGVNPAWLLTGEGSPMLTDVPQVASGTASNLLELVEAMNAVTRMRLGALAGKEHLKVLRELNDALSRYESLRKRLSEVSRGTFDMLLAQVANALDKERNPEKARPLLDACAQISRMCDEPGAIAKYTKLRSRYANFTGDDDEAIRLLRALVLDYFFEHGELNREACNDFHGMIAGLLRTLRLREASAMGDAGVLFTSRNKSVRVEHAAIVEMAARVDIETGRLRRGLQRLVNVVPQLPEAHQRIHSHVSIAFGHALAGTMTYRQASEYCRKSVQASFLARFTLWTEDANDLHHAAKLCEAYRGTSQAMNDLLLAYVRGLAEAHASDSPTDIIDRQLSAMAGRGEFNEYRILTGPVIKAQCAL